MMTDGERAVWAATFDRHRGNGDTAPEAACWAARAVEAMRVAAESMLLDPPARRMLHDMIGKAP